jgi:hypothetical protein
MPIRASPREPGGARTRATGASHPLAPGSRFTCFTGTKVQILIQKVLSLLALLVHLAQEGAKLLSHVRQELSTLLRQVLGLLALQKYKYWYKSTSTDAEGTGFTCFASTKVQILTQKLRTFLRQLAVKNEKLEVAGYTSYIYIHICMYIYIYTCTYTYMYIYMYIYIYIYIYMYVCMYIHVRIYVYTCMFVCMYVCMYVCVHVCM